MQSLFESGTLRDGEIDIETLHRRIKLQSATYSLQPDPPLPGRKTPTSSTRYARTLVVITTTGK